MPCNCIPKVYSYPENSEWGPAFWAVLHGLAERTTQILSPLFENDERRSWIHLLNSTETVLPCPDCSKHYRQWLSINPIGVIQTMPYAEIREFIRRWIYNLHHDVNTRSGKPSIEYEELTGLYKSQSISENFKILELVEKRAVQLQGVKLQSWINWTKHYKTLINIYGL